MRVESQYLSVRDNKMDRYHIVGRAGAGSLIAEFLFREVGGDYDI